MREGGRKAEAGPPFQEEPTPLTPDLTSTCWGAPPPGVFLTEASPQGSRAGSPCCRLITDIMDYSGHSHSPPEGSLTAAGEVSDSASNQNANYLSK